MPTPSVPTSSTLKRKTKGAIRRLRAAGRGALDGLRGASAPLVDSANSVDASAADGDCMAPVPQQVESVTDEPQIRVFDQVGSERMLEAFAACYPDGFIDTDEGRRVADAEIHERHHWFRERYVPWLQSVVSLEDARVLEVGHGFGSSTVPLAEAGAVIDALDIDAGGQTLTGVRAELMGVRDQIEFHVANAMDIGEKFGGRHYDVVAFMATLEHMTFEERVAGIRGAWSIVGPGGVVVIADTPNRLWYFDDHTALRNYFHWLPSDVAIQYAVDIDRLGFADDLTGADAPLRLIRKGRGVSYHDIAIAIGEDPAPYYASGEWEWRRSRDPDYATWWKDTIDGQYHAVLRQISPDLPAGFLESELAICLRKPG